MQVHHVVAVRTFMCPHVLSANAVQEADPLVFTEDLVANMLLADYNLRNERSTLFSAEVVSAKTLSACTWILLVVTRPRRASASAASATSAFAFICFFRTASWFGRLSFGGAAPRLFACGRFGGRSSLRLFGSRRAPRLFACGRFGGHSSLRLFGSRRFLVLGNNFANPEPTAPLNEGVDIYHNWLARVRVLAPHSGALGRALP